MESQPQNPEFRNNPENFHPCLCQMRESAPGQNLYKEQDLLICCKSQFVCIVSFFAS